MKIKPIFTSFIAVLFTFSTVYAETINIYVKKGETGDGTGPDASAFGSIGQAFSNASDQAQDLEPDQDEIVIHIQEDATDGIYILEPEDYTQADDPIASLRWIGRLVPLTLQPYQDDDIVISGAYSALAADYWDTGTWEDTLGIDNHYSHEWPYDWPEFDYRLIPGDLLPPYTTYEWVYVYDGLRFREVFYMDGTQFKQVYTYDDQVGLNDGEFYIDREEEDIIIRSDGDTPGSDDSFIIPNNEFLLDVRRCNSFTLRNITFQHSNALYGNWYEIVDEEGEVVEYRSIGGAAVKITGCKNVVIDGCNFYDNNWIGLNVSGCPDRFVSPTGRRYLGDNHDYDFPIVLIEDCEFKDNGIFGLTVVNVIDLEMQSCELSGNNWRGYSAGTMHWACGASKILHTHNAYLYDIDSQYNLGRGFWFDSDNMNIHLVDCNFSNNSYDGFDTEKNEGPIYLYNCTLDSNTTEPLMNEGIRRVNNAGGGVQNSGTKYLIVYGDESGSISKNENQIFISRFEIEEDAPGMYDFQYPSREPDIRPLFNQFIYNTIDFDDADAERYVWADNFNLFGDSLNYRVINWIMRGWKERACIVEDNDFDTDNPYPNDEEPGRYAIPFDYLE